MPPYRSTRQAVRRLLPSNNPQPATRAQDSNMQIPLPIPVPVEFEDTNPVAALPSTVSHNPELVNDVIGTEHLPNTHSQSGQTNSTNDSVQIQNRTLPVTFILANDLSVDELFQLQSIEDYRTNSVYYYNRAESILRLAEKYNREAKAFGREAQEFLDNAARYHARAGRFHPPMPGGVCPMCPPPRCPAYYQRMHKVAHDKYIFGSKRCKYGSGLIQYAKGGFNVGAKQMMHGQNLHAVEEQIDKYTLGQQKCLSIIELGQAAMNLFSDGMEKYRRGALVLRAATQFNVITAT